MTHEDARDHTMSLLCRIGLHKFARVGFIWQYEHKEIRGHTFVRDAVIYVCMRCGREKILKGIFLGRFVIVGAGCETPDDRLKRGVKQEGATRDESPLRYHAEESRYGIVFTRCHPSASGSRPMFPITMKRDSVRNWKILSPETNRDSSGRVVSSSPYGN